MAATGTILALLSLTITSIGIPADGLDTKGPVLLGYHFARFGLAILLGYAVYTCGRIALRGRSSDFGVTLVLGLALFSLVAFLQGVVAGYYTIVVIAVFMALAFGVPVRADFAKASALWRDQSLPVRFGIGLGVLASILLLVNRGLIPAETDNDVWEHYLHYYDAVLRSHSVWPNELWVHFYVSKGAGAFFIAGLLGDVFSVQLVSWLAVAVVASLLFTLIRRTTGSAVAGAAAALLVFASWNVLDGRAGSFLKHHTVLAALLVSVFWCGYEAVTGEVERRRPIILAGCAAAFYIGVYITVAAGIAAAGLLALGAYFTLFRDYRRKAWIPAALAVAAGFGALVTLGMNYAWTGLALDAPVGIFWPLVDRERFAKLWSPLLIEYWFLGPASYETAKASLATVVTPDLAWWARLLRVPYFKPMWVLTAVALLVALSWRLLRSTSSGAPRRALVAAGAVAAFLLGVLLLSQAFRSSESVYRLYAFTLPFVICALVLVWQGAAAASGAEQRWPVQWALVFAALVCSVSMLRQVPGERWRMVFNYAVGNASTRDTIRLAERTFPGRISTDAISEFRARFPGKGRILVLTYDAAPAYFLPTPPVVSEPSYAFGSRYEELLFAKDPARTEKILKREGVEYVVFNLRNRLFLGLPYSALFSERELVMRFGLAWENDGVVFLGWRSAGVTTPLPKTFLAALDAKKTGEIPDDAEDTWGEEVAKYMRSAKETRDQNSDYLGWLYEEMKARSR